MSTQHDPETFETVRLVWTDLNGIARGILMPSDQFEHATDEGVGFANGVAEFTLEPGLLEDPLFGPQSGDMLAVPDPASLMPVSWQEGHVTAFADLATVDGEPFDLCTRSALRRVMDDLADEGFVPMVGVESEFSLLAPGEGEKWVPYNTRSSYDMTGVDQASDLATTWRDAMAAAGFDLLGVHHESQPGQFEVNLRYDDALATADGITFFRHMLKATARRAGLKATFMPRPHSGEDANGMHFHLSLWDEAREENLFAGGPDAADLEFPAGKHPHDAGISDAARHFVGGLLEHMAALTAVCAPTVNSYKRLVPGIWAPVNIAWGPDNRTTVLRIPPELEGATRIEHRVPDTSSNPYLALAATLAAGLDGIRNGIDPGEPTLANAYHEEHERLPRTLWEALEHLERDEVLVEALGQNLVTEFVKLKRDEFDRYQDHVSEWEREEYLDEF
jgi:glutamine synthetase